MEGAFSPSLVAFYLICALVLGLAILAVTSANLVRAALALAFSFFAVAGIFWLLGSPFLAVLQLVINAGAIPIVTIFIVMMTHSRTSRLRTPVNALGALVLVVPLTAVLLAFVVALTPAAPRPTALGVERLGVELLRLPGQTVTLSSGEVMRVQGGTLVPFELVSVILLAALVGAIILARRNETTVRTQDAGQEEEPEADAHA
jgi:NADH-quinone oxidoreductase subunit J